MSKSRTTMSIDPAIYSRLKARAESENRTVRAVAERCVGQGIASAERHETMAVHARSTFYADVYANESDGFTISDLTVDLCLGREQLGVLIYKLQRLEADFDSGIYDEKEAA